MCNKKLISNIGSSFISAVLILLIQTTASAGIYKWVDEEGQVHYGEKPGNTGAEKVIIRQNETTKPRPIAKDEDESKKEKAEKLAKPEEEKIPRAEKRKLCSEAKSDLAAIYGRGRMREINAKGEYIYLSEDQRQQRISAAKKKQKKYCR